MNTKIDQFETNGKRTFAEPQNEPSSRFASGENTYTAKEIAAALGVSDRTVSQRYLTQLEQIFFWRKDDLRSGNRLTEFAYQECIKLQKAVSPKIPKRDEEGELVYSGKPLMVSNPHRIGFEAYKEQIWEECEIETIVEEEVLNIEVLDEENEALAIIDETGGSIANALDLAKKQGAMLGQQMAAIALNEAAKTFQESFQQGLSAMSQAMTQKPQKKTRRKKTKDED